MGRPKTVPSTARDRQVGGQHYKQHSIQPWDIIDDYDLDFYSGNAIKYICRQWDKDTPIENVEKALHYLEKRLEILKEMES